jgi:hypothetical protein
MKFIRTASVLAISALLVACGGGGAGVASKTGTLVTSKVTGLDTTPIYEASQPVGAVTTTLVAQAPTFSNVKSVSNFTLNDLSGGINSQVVFDMSGVSAGTLLDGSVNGSNTSFSVGDKAWSFARFGMLKNPVNNTEQSTIRYTPFFVADASSSPETLTDATYQTDGLAVGLVSGEKANALKFDCSFSAVYKKSSQELELSFTKCSVPGESWTFDAIGKMGLSSNGTFSLAEVAAPNTEPRSRVYEVLSSGYQFGGPTGQELVGAVTIKSPSTTDILYMTFAFGAKK